MVKSMPTCFILELGQGYASGPVDGDRHCFSDLPELDCTANASAEQDHCAGFIVQQVQENNQLQHTSRSAWCCHGAALTAVALSDRNVFECAAAC